MNPTPRLRFVERVKITHIDNSGNATGTSIRVLQQWYAYDIEYPMTKGEWKDVPLEKEENQ